MAKKPSVGEDDLVLAVHERMIDIWMKLFQDSIEEFQTDRPDVPPVPPEVLARFRQDYEAAVEKLNQMHLDTKGNFTMK